MDILKVSTAVTIVMGPMLDSTDGNTPETALTISQADIRISKNGGVFAQTNNVAGATHMEVGNYSVPLDTTDTGTLGKLRVAIHESGALAVWREFTVVPAMIYDSLVLGTDTVDVNVLTQANIDFGALQKTSLNAATPASVIGAVGSVTGNVGGNVSGSVGSLVGHTAQTGDSYPIVAHADYGNAKLARMGIDNDTLKTLSDQIDLQATLAICSEIRLAELDAANLPTDINNIPNNTEFNARTLPSADYVVVGDTIAGVTTATNLTNAPTIGDLTAAMKLSVNAECDLALADYGGNKIIPDVAGTAATLHGITNGKIDVVDGIVDDIIIDTAVIGIAGAGLTALGDVRIANLDANISSRASASTMVTRFQNVDYVLNETYGKALAIFNKLPVGNISDLTVADIIAGVADGSYDLQKMMRIIFAFASGKTNGGGTATHNFRDSADGTNRIIATVDANGNRTAVTLDPS